MFAKLANLLMLSLFVVAVMLLSSHCAVADDGWYAAPVTNNGTTMQSVLAGPITTAPTTTGPTTTVYYAPDAATSSPAATTVYYATDTATSAPVVTTVQYAPAAQTYVERHYSVAKPVVETAEREEKVIVRKPIVETSQREEKVIVRKPVIETADREETRTVYKPVYETARAGTAGDCESPGLRIGRANQLRYAVHTLRYLHAGPRRMVPLARSGDDELCSASRRTADSGPNGSLRAAGGSSEGARHDDEIRSRTANV